jgi:hypothetical protein
VTADELLDTCRRAGIELTTVGERLRYWAPAGTLTPELRDALVARKPELLDRLRPPRYVTFRRDVRTGQELTVPREALELAWALEDRQIRLAVDSAHQLVIPAGAALTDEDRRAIARWRHHLAAIVEYEDPTCA